MTQTATSLAAEAFEESLAVILRAHRQHAAVLVEPRLPDAPRSRRVLYNALKEYRRLETAFYHAVIGTNVPQSGGQNGNADPKDECHSNDT